jgi:hypothetical protein
VVNKENLAKCHANVAKIVENNIGNLCNDNDLDIKDLDDKLNTLITRDTEIEKQIDDFGRAVERACETSFKRNRAIKISHNHKDITQP